MPPFKKFEDPAQQFIKKRKYLIPFISTLIYSELVNDKKKIDKHCRILSLFQLYCFPFFFFLIKCPFRMAGYMFVIIFFTSPISSFYVKNFNNFNHFLLQFHTFFHLNVVLCVVYTFEQISIIYKIHFLFHLLFKHVFYLKTFKVICVQINK